MVTGPPVAWHRVQTRNGQAFKHKADREYQAIVRQRAQLACPIGWDRDGDFRLHFQFYLHNRRRRDLDNLVKQIMDSLNGVIYHDDSQVSQFAASKELCKKNPRLVVEIVRL